MPVSSSAQSGFSRFFQKSLTQQPQVSKKVRLASWQFQKKIASAAEDCKKSSMQLLRIPEKERLGCGAFKKKIVSVTEDSQKRSASPPPPKCPNPQLIIAISGGGPAKPCARAGKSPAPLLRIKKKNGPRAENSGKSSMRLLRFSKNLQVPG